MSALTLPSRIVLSDVDEGAAGSASLVASATAGYSEAGTDYTNQTKETWVKDTDALAMVNDVLGAVNGTAYGNFVNAGPYQALIEPVGQEQEAGSGTSSTSSTTESLQEITVDVTRANENAPMIVKIWLVEEDGPGGATMMVRGHFTVSQGVSDAYPYGIMEAHFRGDQLDANGEVVGTTPLFTMCMSITAEAGDVVIQFNESGDEGNYQWTNKARILADSDLASGNAYVYSKEVSPGGTDEGTYYFAFNQNYFKYKNTGTGQTTVQDKGDLNKRIFRYKLFDKETGEAVERTSGFPVEFPNGKHGYIGYHGLWGPPGVTATNGMTLTRTETGQQYTLAMVRGRLTKHTKDTVTLGDLEGTEISVWDSGTDNIITWDGTAGKFKKIGTRDGTGTVTYINPQVDFSFSNSWDGGWCEALKAWLRLGHLTIPGATNATSISYHKETMVTPASASDLTLYYWGYAMNLPIDQAEIDGAAAAKTTYLGGAATEKTYFFDATNMVLKETDVNGDQVIMPAGLDLSSSMYADGYHMCPLTTDGGYNSGNCWDIYNDTTYYTWVTGPREWNHMYAVKNASNQYVSFDAPLQFKYTHTTANDANSVSTYNGKKFGIEYDGSDLQIPWKYDETTDEWAPLINLKDGTTLSLSGTDYVVKGIEQELIMTTVSDGATITALESTLPIDETIAAPTLTYDSSKTSSVGDKPTGVELKVIKGELITTVN